MIFVGFFDKSAEILQSLAKDAYFGVLPEEHFKKPDWVYDPSEDESDNDVAADIPKKEDRLYGRCVLTIKFQNKYEYEKWLKYHPDRKWEFMVTYPAVMRAVYDFHTTLDVEIMTKKIIQLLQMGFNVHSASWQLKEYKSQLEDV